MSLSNNFPTIDPSLMLDFANTQSLDPRITFTRTTTAVYYNGVTTAKAEENLLLQSEDFSTSWVPENINATYNSDTAPDGTSTADKMEDGTATSVHQFRQGLSGTLTGVSYAVSVFFKDVDRQYVTIAVSTGTTQWAAAKFDVANGVAGSTSQAGSGWSATSSSITSVGNSWYRCSLVFVAGNAGFTVRCATATDNTTFTANERGLESYTGTNASVLLWGAQLEQRSAVTAYTPTTTQPITNYIPVLLTAAAGQARFDHNPTTGQSLGLLIEEQRTNSILQSEDFTTTWATTRASITSNTIVAPNGTLTGDKLVEDTTASNSHFVSQAISWTSGTSYTLSMYAKKGERNWINMRLPSAGFTSSLDAYFDLNSGVVGSVTSPATSSITPVGNGWYRCSITAAATTTASGSLIVFIAEANGDVTFTGDGYSGIFIWGAQLEAGAFPTSYIATTGSTATRNADVATMTGTNFSSWFNNAEGTLYGEASTYDVSTGKLSFAVTDGSTSNRIHVGHGASPKGFVGNGGVTQLSISIPSVVYTNNTFSKTILAYANDDGNAAANGTNGVDDTSLSVPIVTQAQIGALTSTNSILNGTIKKIAYYPLRLTNEQLQALTS